MPTGKGNDSGSNNNPAQRTTFRPPWVKEGPTPLPVPTAPWTLKNANRRDSNTTSDTPENPLAGVQLRKISVQTKEPQENGNKESTFVKPALKPVPPKEGTSTKKEHRLSIPKLNSVAERQLKDPPRKPSITKLPSDDDEIDKAMPATRNALVRAESMRRLSQGPAPPPMPPMPPPPPNMPEDLLKKPLNKHQQEKLEQLKSRPKNRPDWTAMLKEIEGNKKLKHVVCNDRSQPLLPEAKAKEHFLYESEKPNVHNELLKQIQSGIHLKRVKTNDRSKPMLEGLRKFRRQMTIEEQIQKSISMASIAPEEIQDEADEMDDIDKVRDDLQSTKQMLALELRNKEAQERENKRLLSRIQNLEAELEKERSRQSNGNGKEVNGNADEKLIKSLKTETEQARKAAEDLEKKFTQTAEQLDNTKSQLEETKKQNQLLEKKLQALQQGKRLSFSDRPDRMVNGDESDDEIEEEESTEESEDEDNEEKREKKNQRELKQLSNKLRNFKNKEDNAKKERIALREIIKQHQHAIKEEKKKFKQLQKEVDKMAALMKESSDDEEEAEEEEDKDIIEEEDESEESSEEETESESDESESERSQSEPDEAPIEKKKENLTVRSKRHENILGALKKGNFMLKANAERLQDDLNKQKEMTATLQEDLDSVLSELG